MLCGINRVRTFANKNNRETELQPEKKLVAQESQFTIRNFCSVSVYSSLANDVKDGLLSTPKSLPAKYFYDEKGSALFDQICDTEEYYPTRTEEKLLSDFSQDVIEATKPERIVELGSGISRKTVHLLNACEETDCLPTYQPVDICREIIEIAGDHLQSRFPWLDIDGVVADYMGDLNCLSSPEENRLFVFLGGTFGNFDEDEATGFLHTLRTMFNKGDSLLIGVDRIKNTDLLNAAYNDKQGYTAEFNLNVLNVLNRELNSNFESSRFRHEAWFNEEMSRIEMHLRSIEKHEVVIGDLGVTVSFEKNETIMTEISRKFTPDSFEHLLNKTGFRIDSHYEPENGHFSLFLAKTIT